MRKALVLSASLCALAGALAAAGLAGPASAARTWAGVPAAGSVPGGIISTVAGGVGGPGRATSVAISACGLRWAGGGLYIGGGSTVRRVSMATDALTAEQPGCFQRAYVRLDRPVLAVEKGTKQGSPWPYR